MSIVEVLSNINDRRKGGDQCQFNGYLEDYLETLEEGNLKTSLAHLFEEEQNLRIIVDLSFGVNKDVISNQIIRYKDASKLPAGFLKAPYIVYGKAAGDAEMGILLIDGDKSDYPLAKGLYYCLTEQTGLLENARNELVAVNTDQPEVVGNIGKKLLAQTQRVGALQREVDRHYYNSFAALNDLVLAKAEDLKIKTVEACKETAERSDLIYGAISKWYLLKKTVYVQYMTNKDLLEKDNEGNIKKQRHNAKLHADQVPFMAFSELWRV